MHLCYAILLHCRLATMIHQCRSPDVLLSAYLMIHQCRTLDVLLSGDIAMLSRNILLYFILFYFILFYFYFIFILFLFAAIQKQKNN